MAFNNNPDELENRVDEEDALRRRLETPIARDFRRLFRQIGRDLTDMYVLTGRVLDAEQYMADITSFLRNGYQRTANVFNHSVEDHIIENQDNNDEELIAAFIMAAAQRNSTFDEQFGRFTAQRNIQVQQFINTTVPLHAEEITSTNQNNIDRAITQALANAEEQEEEITQSQIGRDAGALFAANNLFRGEMIAETEVLNASEGVKGIEVAAFMAVAGFLGGLESDKIWITRGDDIVRPTHVAVDFATVPSEENFTVGGFPMDRPGDGSQGAPASEIVRCRCNSQYVIQ